MPQEHESDHRSTAADGYGPRPLDETTPNAARLYDYYLGGAHNFEADRELAEQILAAAPITRIAAQANRAFLQRAVRYLVDLGIDQFLDLGSGVPTAGNVHEIAQAANPAARVVYVDYEPVAYHAARDMLAGNDNATILQADLREVDTVLAHPDVRRLLDFTRPIGVLLVGVLLFLTDEDRPGEIVARYRSALPTGSYLVLSHASGDEAGPELRAQQGQAQSGYRKATERLHMRSKAEFASWFTGTELVAPGVVPFYAWQPTPRSDPPLTAEQLRANQGGYVGIGRIPG